MNKTFRLFLISLAIVLVTMTVATFANYLNLGRYGILLPAIMVMAFGVSIAGLIFGVSEVRNPDNKKVIIGISGHLLILFLFFYLVYTALTMAPDS